MSFVENFQLVYKNSVDSAKKTELDLKTKIPYFYLYNDHLVIYPQRESSTKKHTYNDKSKLNLEKEKYTGKISDAAKRKVKQRITSWLKSITIYNDQKKNKYRRKIFYPVFVTLTLSSKQVHSDNHIKRELLGLFIKKIQRTYGVDNYFWRAEKQKNGNIHFHLLIDKYISYNQIRLDWNHIQNKKNYLKDYKEKYKKSDPNSVDVRSAKTVKNFIDYALKYMVKNEDGLKVNGRIWGMSDKLRDLKTYQDIISYQINSELNKCIESKQVRVYKGEYFTCIYFEKSYFKSGLNDLMMRKSKQYYLEVYDELYLKEKETEPKPKPKPKPPPPPPDQLEFDIQFPTIQPNYDFENCSSLN